MSLSLLDKSHVGFEGKERADKLSKEAAIKLKIKPTYEKMRMPVKH